MTTLLLLIYTKYSTPCHLKKNLEFRLNQETETVKRKKQNITNKYIYKSLYLVDDGFGSLFFQIFQGCWLLEFELDPSSFSVAKVTQQIKLGHVDTAGKSQLRKNKNKQHLIIHAD